MYHRDRRESSTCIEIFLFCFHFLSLSELTASVDPLSIQYHAPYKLLHTPQNHCTPPSSPETLRPREWWGLIPITTPTGLKYIMHNPSSSIFTCRFWGSTQLPAVQEHQVQTPCQEVMFWGCFAPAEPRGQQLCLGALRLSQWKMPGELTATYTCSSAHLPTYLCSCVTAEKSVKFQCAQISLR